MESFAAVLLQADYLCMVRCSWGNTETGEMKHLCCRIWWVWENAFDVLSWQRRVLPPVMAVAPDLMGIL